MKRTATLKMTYRLYIGILISLTHTTAYADVLTYQVIARISSILDLSGGAGVNGFFKTGDMATFRFTYDTATSGSDSTSSVQYTGAVKSFSFSYSNGYTGAASSGTVYEQNNVPVGANNQPTDSFIAESTQSDGWQAPIIGNARLVDASILLVDSSATAFASTSLVALPPLSSFTGSQVETIYQNTTGGTSYVKASAISIWAYFQGHLYQRTSAAMNWDLAESEAQSVGGHLVAINSAEEQTFLEQSFLSAASQYDILWIGLNDAASEGHFVWSNGDPLIYTNWKSGEPNNSNGNEDYVAMNWGFERGDVPKGKWNDAPIAGTIGFNVRPGPYFGIIEKLANQAPVANAGADQAARLGTTIRLNGSGSYDDNTATDALAYRWNFVAVPDGSGATLLNPTSEFATFVADKAGTYVVQLVVTDQEALSSAPDEVMISTENMAPTAQAGNDVLVVTGSVVNLNGSASTDPEKDRLTFYWSLVSAPVGSSAVLTGATTANPTLVPDVDGQYVVQLVVNDLIGSGNPDTVVITATTPQTFADVQIQYGNTTVVSLPPTSVTTGGNQNAFTNFLSQATLALQVNDSATAIQKLQQAIERTDGCVLRGAPDGNGPGRDWITDCVAQQQTYLFLSEALRALGFQ